MSQAANEVRLIHVNGIDLAYQSFGEGAPVILLHGGYGAADLFGPNIAILARRNQVVGVDLQSHGRTPATRRPMRFETMADDIAELIQTLQLQRPAVMGFSLGGAVALRTAIQHSELVSRLIVVSTPFKRSGWHPEMTIAMDAMGPEVAEPMKASPMFELYSRVAPNREDWPVLVEQITSLLKIDCDWSGEVAALPMPVMIVAGDADGLPPSHAVAFFELLGAGKRDANWDRSGMTHHRLAILPGLTHYDIDRDPLLGETASRFLNP